MNICKECGGVSAPPERAPAEVWWEVMESEEREPRRPRSLMQRVEQLPANVWTALQNKQWSLAVGLAVHYGFRDETDLVDLVMNQRHPELEGRKIKTSENALATEWKSVRDSIVRPILAAPAPPLAQAGPIPCVARARELADERPETPAIDLTGRYEVRYEDLGTLYTIALNHAGNHIEGVSTTVLVPSDTPSTIPDVTSLHGDLQKDGSYLMFSREKPDYHARLSAAQNDGSIVFEARDRNTNKPGSIRAIRVRQRATLMSHALKQLPSALSLKRKYESTPLTHEIIAELRALLAPARIERFLQDFFSIDETNSIALAKARNLSARKFNDYLHDQVFSAKRFHPFYLDMLKREAIVILSLQRWTRSGTKRSHLDWLEIMMSLTATHKDYSEAWGKLNYMRSYLGLKGRRDIEPDAPQQQYRITLTGMSGSAGIVIADGSFFEGDLKVEKLTDKKWSRSYPVFLVGLSGGWSTPVSFKYVKLSGTSSSFFSWGEGDIPGRIELLEAGGSIGAVGGVQAGATILMIKGSEMFPQLTVELMDFDTSIQIGGGIELSGSMGWAYPADDYSKRDMTQRKIETDYAAVYAMTTAVHFCLDSALLTESARQALRIVCASELPAFSSSGSRLQIIGHADRTDSDERNLTLSAMRAANVRQAIEDILGSKLRIPNDNIKVSGKGESAAAPAGRGRPRPNAPDRRVDVFLNGQLVLTMRAD